MNPGNLFPGVKTTLGNLGKMIRERERERERVHFSVGPEFNDMTRFTNSVQYSLE
jgi:hypothetical protein